MVPQIVIFYICYCKIKGKVINISLDKNMKKILLSIILL